MSAASLEGPRLQRALDHAAEALLARRLPEGYWEGRLSSSALSTATAVSALAVAGLPDDRPLAERGRGWLAATQNADGGWGDTPDSPSNLATSLLAVAALTLAGEAPAWEATLARASAWLAGRAGNSPVERAAPCARSTAPTAPSPCPS